MPISEQSLSGSVRRCGLAAAALVGVAFTSATAWGQVAPERVAVVNARIIPIDGPEIEKGSILIERGKIKAVGADIDIPYDARVFDATGKVVMPGAIVAHNSQGMGWQDEPRPITPQLDVFDSLDPSDLAFEDALRSGITAIHVMPGVNTAMGGVGRVVRPIGMTPPEMLISGPHFVMLSVSPKAGVGSFQPADRMVQRANLRETFIRHAEAVAAISEQRYEARLAEQEKKLDVGPAEARQRGLDHIRLEDIPDDQRNLLRLTGGILKAEGKEGPRLLEPLGGWVYCEDAMDVDPAVAIAKDYGFFDRLVLFVGPGAYRAIDSLRSAARPIVLSSELTHRRVDPLTGEVIETFAPKALHDAGLRFAILPGDNTTLPERFPTYRAAVLVRNGIPRDTALRSITIEAARALGLEDRLGSLTPGKDGSLVVLSGDPLDFNSVVERVIIEGIPCYDRARDVRIQRLRGSTPPPATSPAPAESTTPADAPADEATEEHKPEAEGDHPETSDDPDDSPSDATSAGARGQL